MTIDQTTLCIKRALNRKAITEEEASFWLDIKSSMDFRQKKRLRDILENDILYKDKTFELKSYFNRHLLKWKENRTEGFI